MSGYKLRALLEDSNFCSSLSSSNSNLSNPANAAIFQQAQMCHTNSYQNHSDNRAPHNGYVGQSNSYEKKEKSVTDVSGNNVNASLLRNDIWQNNGEDNFNLEYMDLDEFLNETGLLDTNFTNLVNSSHLGSPASPSVHHHTSPGPQNSPQSSLKDLLLSNDDAVSRRHSLTPSSPGSAASSEQGVVSLQEVLHQSLSPQRPLNDAAPHATEANRIAQQSAAVKSPEAPSNSITLTSSQIVKKRKYSEDGEGLAETSVVVVPGQEGFNPAAAKFAPEELQPQPIIKKSKKQFVPEESKDEKYWKRRNKNNVAAKRSREARRAKENQIIMRAGFLESENERLTGENNELKQENEKLRNMIARLQEGQR